MKFSIKASIAAIFIFCNAFASDINAKVVSADDITWGYLNPLRGELSPGAANLWGDRTKDTATGMLVRFKKGFESPPHIHNITYRGVVINGLMHNDDPSAEKMWLPSGSFWTQPAGEDHITAANGDSNLIYLEIDSGPYLVQPSAEKFDNGERPLNLHRDNLVWLNNHDLHDIKAEGVKSSFLWNSNSTLGGSMVKLPVGFNGSISTQASEFRMVVISGEINYRANPKNAVKNLAAGSYIESTGQFSHKITNQTDREVIIYIRTNAKYQVI
ncbi:DUF4437 domain-containing protein [Pseudoalteromonas sp. Of11M-6]|uniref:DUF4437 domain-containing protein n=1 Tax=Pseudoalteromonas sp. Of11M-6 TaxID=2917754 RepID=UPI001EF57369|nr:DUF4437 domain-containing protein [Pseudoalteromonas sp. Of11M-6]MCG7554827.1 DUF4437 domain-containing protein [Pseudoalteromonas sp. Of11M-6]